MSRGRKIESITRLPDKQTDDDLLSKYVCSVEWSGRGTQNGAGTGTGTVVGLVCLSFHSLFVFVAACQILAL